METATKNEAPRVVKVAIKNRESYTKYLYDSIQGAVGVVVLGPLVKDGWVRVEFGASVTELYKRLTKNWGQLDRTMTWLMDQDDLVSPCENTTKKYELAYQKGLEYAIKDAENCEWQPRYSLQINPPTIADQGYENGYNSLPVVECSQCGYGCMEKSIRRELRKRDGQLVAKDVCENCVEGMEEDAQLERLGYNG